jgi:hypothetical protein
MKKIIHSLFIITLIAFLFSACKKKDVKITTAEKVQGTWQLQSDIYHEFVGGVDHSDTTAGINGTIEFRNDGKVYSNNQGEKDTTVYTLSGDTHIIIDKDQTYDIKELTSNSFVLYTKEVQGADYTEETISLKK